MEKDNYSQLRAEAQVLQAHLSDLLSLVSGGLKVTIGGSLALKEALGGQCYYFFKREVHDIDLIVVGRNSEIEAARAFLYRMHELFVGPVEKSDSGDYNSLKLRTLNGVKAEVLFKVIYDDNYDCTNGFETPENVAKAKWHYTIQRILKGMPPRPKDVEDLRVLGNFYPKAVPHF